MKKMLAYFLTLLSLFALISCNNQKKIYSIGETVEKDGVLYEYNEYCLNTNYVTLNGLETYLYDEKDKYINYFDNKKELTFNVMYPFDLVNYEKYKNITPGFAHIRYNEIIEKYGEENTINRYTFNMLQHLMFNNISFQPYYEYCQDSRIYRDIAIKFFIVKGLSSEKSDITIPTDIDGYPVLGIGNYAFENKKINNLVVSSYPVDVGNWRFCVMPYAFSNAQINNVSIKQPSAILPLAFNNTTINDKLYLTKTCILDAGIYNADINNLEIKYYNNIFTGSHIVPLDSDGSGVYGMGYINPPILNSNIKDFKFSNGNLPLAKGIKTNADLIVPDSPNGVNYGTQDPFITEIKYSWDVLYYYFNPEIVLIDGVHYLRVKEFSSKDFVIKPLIFNKDKEYDSLYYSFPISYSPFKSGEYYKLEGENNYYHRKVIFDNYIHNGEIDNYVFKKENLKNVKKLYVNVPNDYSWYDYKKDVLFENNILYINNIYTFDESNNSYWTKIFEKPNHLELVLNV